MNPHTNGRRGKGPLRPIVILALALASLGWGPEGMARPSDAESASPKWVEYRDQRYGYGLAVPSDWHVHPTSFTGQQATLTLWNYDEQYARYPTGQDSLTTGAVKIEFIVFEQVDRRQPIAESLSRLLNNETSSVLSIEGTRIGSHSGARVVTQSAGLPSHQATSIALQLPLDRMLLIDVSPDAAWQSNNVQAMLRSLALSPSEKVTLPGAPPDPSSEPSPGSDRGGWPAPPREIHPCTWGNEVEGSPIDLFMPFAEGTTWTVGGVGSYYGDNWHAGNDYYATDWHKGTYASPEPDFGEALYPVAPGSLSAIGFDADGYGNYVIIAHDQDVTTLYGHLDTVSGSLEEGDPVDIFTQIGTVGGSGGGGTPTDPHLHLSFLVGGVSQQGVPPSRRPSPMWTSAGWWELCDSQSATASKGISTPTPTSSPSPTSTPTATATPTPSATLTATSTPNPQGFFLTGPFQFTINTSWGQQYAYHVVSQTQPAQTDFAGMVIHSDYVRNFFKDAHSLGFDPSLHGSSSPWDQGAGWYCRSSNWSQDAAACTFASGVLGQAFNWPRPLSYWHRGGWPGSTVYSAFGIESAPCCSWPPVVGNFTVYYIWHSYAPTPTPTPTLPPCTCLLTWWRGLCTFQGDSFASVALQRSVRVLREASIDLTLFQRLRDEVMNQTEEGQRLIGLYDDFSLELISVLSADAALREEGEAVLELWQPNLQLLVDGAGATVDISQEQVDAVESFLDHLAAAASPELKTVIDKEEARNRPGQFVGMTMSTAWSVISEGRVYLPLVEKQ